MKMSFRQRVFLYFFIIFACFTASIIIIEQQDEKKYRTEALESKLDGITESLHEYIKTNNLIDSNLVQLHSILQIFPQDLRVTIINAEGKVLFDKDVKDVNTLENHLDRPEIMKSLFNKYGTNIRLSTSTQHEYLYLAKSYPECFVRVAMPYNINTKSLLKADNAFIYAVLILFVLVLILVNYVAGRFGKSISSLHRFTRDIKDNKPLPEHINFPEDEVGDIGYELVEILKQKEVSKRKIEVEKDKLIQHFQYSGEGLGIFKANFDKVYTNTHFIQYLNLISHEPTFDACSIFNLPDFEQAKKFLNDTNKTQNFLSFNINASGKSFLIQVIQYEDKKFEISIRDVTKVEKNRLLKQEMTNNIAHELRTPVTSLRGYLETLSENSLTEEKKKQFIQKAYTQSIRLSNLIEDVSMLSKVEEAGDHFSTESVNLAQVVDEVRIDLSKQLATNHIKFISTLRDDLRIKGNYTLLYSIFRNLTDNSINYGGKDIEIHVDNYMEDNDFLYFSYYDTGKGVEEQHLTKLFERFYRIDEGRTRDSGGSGLGLSIVKNAIILHKGEIQAKNRKDGGLEFLFTLKKG